MRPTQDSDVFHAIAHPVRRALLSSLRRGEQNASDLAAPFAISFAAVSQHLRTLEDAELVAVRRDGRHRLYSLRAQPLAEVNRWLDDFATYFDARLDALGAYLDQKHGR